MQQRTIIIEGHVISYTLKRYTRSRRINMIMHHDGALVVTAPSRYPLFLVKQALRRNASWFMAQQIKYAQKKNVTIDAKVQKHIREYVRAFVTRKCVQYNQYYGFAYNRITIRQQKTRWGSCSTQGNLNFNIRLIYLPEALRDYIIVHELCHLQEMNHAPAFWTLVARQVPDYRMRRALLRRFAKRL